MAHTTPPGKTIDGTIYRATGGEARHAGDFRQLKQGRETHVGFHIGNYLAAPPFFFTRDGREVSLLDKYRGCAAFLIASGPSLLKLEYNKLYNAGILTMGMNNSVKTFRPNMWCCVDDPTHFIKSIWRDPKIEKFVPFDHAEKQIIDSTQVPPKVMNTKVGDCPSVWYFRRNEYFVAERFLFEDTFNWGNHSDIGGARSVMLPSIRTLFLTGVRTIFLCGVDFNMSETNKYHFEQDRTRSSINGNNGTYAKLNDRFKKLRPIMETHGLNIYNCNPESGLTAFDHMPFEDALKMAHDVGDFPDISQEQTAGLYDRESPKRSKDIKEQVVVANQAAREGPRTELYPPIDEVIRDLNIARAKLHEAKAKYEELEKSSPNDPRRADHEVYKRLLDELNNDIITKRKVFRGFCDLRDKIKGIRK